MSKITRLFIGLLLILYPFVQPVSSTGIVQLRSETVDATSLSGSSGILDEESEHFLKAKSLIFHSRWKEARHSLEEYLKSYPSGKYRDEAIYWLAQSLDKLSRNETDPQTMISLKEMAMEKLNILIEEFPQSIWCDDAWALKVEISGMLAVLGKSESRETIQKIARSEAETDMHLKMLGLNALLDLEPNVAISLLKQILADEKEPSLRKRALLLLVRHYSEASLAAVASAAQKDPDEEVRKVAAFWVKQINRFRIPTALNYYVLEARIKELDKAEMFPEDKVSVFELPRTRLRSEKEMESTVQRYFRRELKSFHFRAGVYGNVYTYERKPSCMAHDIVINVFIDTEEKTPQSIKGKIRFYDNERQKEFWVSYDISDKNETLLAVRRGNNVALLVLQFEVLKKVP